MGNFVTHVLWIATLIYIAQLTKADPAPKYNAGDKVPVSINTVGPYRNPNEKYPFLDKVPFCKPQNAENKKEGGDAGSVFMGDRATLSDYILLFKTNIHEPKTVCTYDLDQNGIKKYISIIRENYMFEFFVDHNLLVTGFLGKEEVVAPDDANAANNEEEEKKYYYLFTHWNFHCEHNGHYVISCRITTDLDKQIELRYGEDLQLVFTYSVTWEEVSVSVHDRLMYHVRRLVRSQPLDVHWLSTLNSFILVILVTAFVALVFTTILRQDCAKYHELVIMTRDDLEDVGDPGWKQLQRDVFRAPARSLVFSAIIGTGTQLLVLMISILLLSLIGLFYPGNRGSIISSIIFVYCFTSGIAGHVSSTLYKQLGGTKWATLSILTACLFTMPFFAIFLFVNGTAWHYHSSIALPFSTIASVFGLWLFVTLPLTIYASRRVFQHHAGSDRENNNNNTLLMQQQYEVSKVPREIPTLPWYRSSYLQIALSGILPFTAIYIELHFLFMAIFGHQVYTLFGILSLAFIMLLIVTCAVTIGLTYFQLQSEDWRWWWTSLFTAGSTGIYIFAYSIFYYVYRSYMTGFLQAAIFFGYISIVSYSFLLMLGATGWWATYLFLRQIYAAIKSE
eukprot:CAMPEP_0197073100 /NCGR_PEP_ID=MMETSP1384-20130603/210433_1 /TAXON_ID=29189 /ORGANISM="Ammonia sp." /LENGTH=619 /DNA_ID=CAMNT_0042511925 /DNA_START=36 /DNA_END=1895 /DNA_ORIENTATION=-